MDFLRPTSRAVIPSTDRCTYCLDIGFKPSRAIFLAASGEVPWKRMIGGAAGSRRSLFGTLCP